MEFNKLHKIVIFDEDVDYLNAFINSIKNLNYLDVDIIAFSNKSLLDEYLIENSNLIDILITSKDVNIKLNKVFMLCETDNGLEDYIYKYQSINNIISKLMQYVGIKAIVRTNNFKKIGIYSYINIIHKNKLIDYYLDKCIGNKILIKLDRIHSEYIDVDDVNTMVINDLIYFYSINKSQMASKLISLPYNSRNIKLIINKSNEVVEIENWIDFLNQFDVVKDLNYVFIDIPVYNIETLSLFEALDEILVPSYGKEYEELEDLFIEWFIKNNKVLKNKLKIIDINKNHTMNEEAKIG